MPTAPALSKRTRRGFTIMEVLLSSVLIALSVGSIMSINMKSIDTLRVSHQTAASSQVLQERIEMMRKLAWAEVASSTALATLMGQPTPSESELADGSLTETILVSTYQDSANGPVEGSRSFQISRTAGVATVNTVDDLTTEPALFVQDAVTWHDHSGAHQRTIRTIICSAGLTRSGIVGSRLGSSQ